MRVQESITHQRTGRIGLGTTIVLSAVAGAAVLFGVQQGPKIVKDIRDQQAQSRLESAKQAEEKRTIEVQSTVKKEPHANATKEPTGYNPHETRVA